MDKPEVSLLKSRRMNAQFTETAPVTVNDILGRYERDCLHELAPRTQKDYRRHLGHLRARFGPLNAAELKQRDFGPLLDIRKGRTQRARQLAVLSSAFTQAVSYWYLLDRNVLRDVKRPKNKPRDRLIADDEFEGCKGMSSKRIQLAMRLALITGQRQGDIISFRWTDIEDLPEPIWDERAKQFVTMELNVLQRKTGKRIGICIPKDLETLLDECYQLKGGGKDGSEFILPKQDGKQYTSEGFRAIWQRAINRYCRRGGVRFTFHDIRALCATKCPTPEYAMKLLGHSNISMTLRIYRRGKERVMALTI